ncbi:MAG: hypothetical protein HZB26_24005 [Candidatus Hydrogenedentes bacterium]|nr:hypothetical protein [Candidatus Hydrogenedentota bacterium]
MTSDPQKASDSAPQPAQDLVRGMQRVGDHLLAGMEEDSRVQSGVPDEHLSDDLDFIQMTGLARPSSLADNGAEVSFASRLDPSGSLSFYEQGVADVDTALTPRHRMDAEDVAASMAERISEARGPHENYSIDDLKQIISELSQPSAALERPVSDVERPVEAGVRGPAQASEPDGFGGDAAGDSPGGRAEPPETPQTILVSKTDSLSELLERELAAQPIGSTPDPEPQSDTEHAPETQELSPLLEPVRESPETPSLEPVSSINDFEPLGDLSAVFDDIIPGPTGGLAERSEDAEVTAGVSQAPPPSDPEEAKPFSHDLVEVERLLKALQEQPRDVPASSVPAPAMSGPQAAPRAEYGAGGSAAPEPAELFGQEKDESVYRRPQDRRRKRATRVRGRLRRRLLRLAVLGGFLLVVAAAGYFVFRWSQRGLATPESTLSNAAGLAAKGSYGDAASAYGDFVARNPNHAKRPDAQFSAAFYLQIAPSDASASDASVTGAARLEQSLKQFQQFIEDNPLHAKAPRAKTLAGLLQYRLKRYKEAVDQLHSPSLRAEDPNASLVILRTLASSYARLGDFESARSAYLQAASLPDNYSPDRDYQELSDLCKSMADQASTPEEKRRYLDLYAEQLSHAILAPGIDPVSKKRLQSLLATRQPDAEAAPDGTAAPAAKPAPAQPAPVAAPPAATGAAEPAQSPASALDRPAPAAPSTLNAEPDPRLEAQQLSPSAPPTAPPQTDVKESR